LAGAAAGGAEAAAAGEADRGDRERAGAARRESDAEGVALAACDDSPTNAGSILADFRAFFFELTPANLLSRRAPPSGCLLRGSTLCSRLVGLAAAGSCDGGCDASAL